MTQKIRHYLQRLGMIVTLSLWIAGCSYDEELIEPAPHSDVISFGVTDATATRVGHNMRKPGTHFVLRDHTSSDTLCVNASVTHGITTPSHTATRGAQVTDMASYAQFNIYGHLTNLNSNSTNIFMYNERATQSGATWTTANLYYWLGSGCSYRFYAFAPETSSVTTSDGVVYAYTVPQSVPNQKDLLVARTNEIAGDYNQAVPLTFNHICTAVRIVGGKSPLPGTVKSVKLSGILNSGNYNADQNQWQLGSSTDNYTLTINKALASASETELNPGENTFILLPQICSESASMEVVFLDGVTGKERIFTAPLAGQNWQMGKTTTYSITITPDYELEFDATPEPQDAHYVICPITIQVDDRMSGGWTLSSPEPWVTFTDKETNLSKEGYWIEEDRGSQSFTGTATGSVTVYAYLDENAGTETRSVLLELRPAVASEITPATLTLSQYAPDWSGGIGCERIEDTTAPWGFKWDRKVVYKSTDFLWRLIIYLSANNTIEQNNAGSYVTSKYQFLRQTTITIDYSKLSDLSNEAGSTTDGLTNSKNLYNFKGIANVTQMETTFDGWGMDKTVTGSAEIVSNFAALKAIQKNKFHKRTESVESNGQTVTYDVAYINDADIVWYLPARDQFNSLQGLTTPLSGSYWSSTDCDTPDDYIHAYKYANGSYSLEPRTSILKVRAVRQPL